jgi:hypothetical protein
MANAEKQPASESAAETRLESGTYEIIRGRLKAQAQELRQRLAKLNAARKDVFGSIETVLLATERVTTAHNCVPRDLAPLKQKFLFGYNVHFGLKTTTEPSDVFAAYELRDNTFHELPLDMLQDPMFVRDFREIYRYYKDATFASFFRSLGFLYMVFQVGKTTQDIKTLKWAVQGDALVYVDNRSDHEVRYPPQHEFEWIRTRREQHRFGRHPHISIEDRVFVETVGGDLTVKIEDSTDNGKGIYAEEVLDPDQTLDDAEIFYALVGNLILLKVRPYRESDFRHIVFNEKTQKAGRVDSIQHACVLLPDDHGLIFSNGYYLQTGEYKLFDNAPKDMVFERRVAAPNGEDYLYIFHNQASGERVLLHYNAIEQQVQTPLICHGATLLHGGELVCFKRQEEPQKHHALQIWRTPYVHEEAVQHADTESFLYKIGNRDVVRGMSECHEVLNLIDKEDTYGGLYIDLVKLCGDILDSYFWIDRPEAAQLDGPLKEIRQTAAAAVDEFEKVVRVRRNTSERSGAVQQQVEELLSTVHRRRFDSIEPFVQSLSELRRVRGEIIGLRELKYADLPLIDKLEKQVTDDTGRLAQRCVQFLLQPQALQPYHASVAAHAAAIPEVKKVAEARKLEEKISATAGELEMLIDVVSNLKIDDATQRTAIIDSISANFVGINQARAALKARTKELMSAEGLAEFNAQIKLLNQSVVNYLDLCDSPAKCDELLTKLAVQIEEQEGRFAEFDEFVLQLTEKREEVYNAFEARKLALVEARNKRTTALMSAAERILKGIKSRVDSLESLNDIHSYFASDLMIEKVRDIVRQLQELDDSVKVDDIQSRLKSVREDAVRQLKDRQELFVEGENVIQFGRHRFSVNVQPLDLTSVLRDGRLCLHLTGTDFFEPLEDEQLLATRDVWEQEYVSENGQVYRGEFLAYRALLALGESLPPIEKVLRLSDDDRLELVRKFMGPRYAEGYMKGVHDADASRLLKALLDMKTTIGLLRFHPTARAMAAVFWTQFCDPARKAQLTTLLRGHSTVARLFPKEAARQIYIGQLAEELGRFAHQSRLYADEFTAEAAEYLYEECLLDKGFVISRTAARLREELLSRLKSQNAVEDFTRSLDSVRKDPVCALQLARDWARAFLATGGDDGEHRDYADEFAALLAQGDVDPTRIVDGDANRRLEGFAGSHAVIEKAAYQLNYNRFLRKLSRYDAEIVPRFQTFTKRKKELVEHARQDMRLSEFQPRVLTSFVRNKLLDTVYLPLIGDNLAKQIGVVGDQKRTDRMGLLLLLSPPGYGKTTLMEYIANRLGLVFMKINGPAIGHRVTSLDPNEAPNAAAREELDKLNLSLEMGDNVMIYVDDIQHCHAEFLQKFISLCDAQRKIEGVYRGHTRTYDLRGRKVCVIMAGNPYTESGQRFQIPDMLSNRADVYNLGEIIGDSREAFELSYLENALTSNAVLSRLATRSQKDVYGVVRIAETGTQEGVDLEGNFSADELNEMVAVTKKLLRVRDIVLKVNREYIRSAAQSDDYRTEPPFKLQGSYRNMNRIAERVVPIMNDAELTTLIVSSYENDAQTLTADTESNLLKFKELMGILSPAEAERWEDIKRTFRQNLKLKGVGSDDKAGLVIAQLGSLGDALDAIRKAMLSGTSQLADRDQSTALITSRVEDLASQLGTLREQIAVPPAAAPEAIASESPGSGPSAEDLEEGGPLHRVVVQHKVPRSILEVVRSQFDLMKGWLEPVYLAAQQQSADMSQLQKTVESCLTQYAALLEELEHARRKTKR